MLIESYLFFDGHCEEAIAFYQQAIGAKVEMVARYKESPEPMPPGTHAGYGEKIMHANLRIGDSSVMMSDDCTGNPKFQGFALSLLADDAAQARQRFDALAAGGQVTMPLGKTFFSPCFGMLTDRFGVAWMVIVMAEPA